MVCPTDLAFACKQPFLFVTANARTGKYAIVKVHRVSRVTWTTVVFTLKVCFFKDFLTPDMVFMEAIVVNKNKCYSVQLLILLHD